MNVTIVTQAKAREATRQAKSRLKTSRRSAEKLGYRISELTILVNNLEEEIPALEARLAIMKQKLPELKEQLPKLKLSYKGFQKNVALGEQRLEISEKREALIKRILELEKSIEE